MQECLSAAEDQHLLTYAAQLLQGGPLQGRAAANEASSNTLALLVNSFTAPHGRYQVGIGPCMCVPTPDIPCRMAHPSHACCGDWGRWRRGWFCGGVHSPRCSRKRVSIPAAAKNMSIADASACHDTSDGQADKRRGVHSKSYTCVTSQWHQHDVKWTAVAAEMAISACASKTACAP